MVNCEWLGLTSFDQADFIQNEHVRRLSESESEPGSILGLEHSTVLTLGLRSSDPNQAFVSGSTAGWVERGYDVRSIRRGGQATIHSPGQLVIYPVMNLRVLKLGTREFVRILEESIIKTFAHYGVKTRRHDTQPGVFTDCGKIAFIGLRIQRGVSSHGISLNIRNETNLFKEIVACGCADQPLDRLSNYQVDAPLKNVFGVFTRSFIERLDEKGFIGESCKNL